MVIARLHSITSASTDRILQASSSPGPPRSVKTPRPLVACRRSVLIALAMIYAATPNGAAQTKLSEPAPADSMEIIAHSAVAAYRLGTREGVEHAIELFGRLAELQTGRGMRREAGKTYASIGTLHGNLSRPDSALLYYDRSLKLLEASDDRPAYGKVLALVGQALHGKGEVRAALDFYRRALRTSRGEGDGATEALALNNLGIAHRDLGAPDSALHHLTAALVIRRATSDPQGEAVTLNNIARVHELLGRADSAVSYLRLSLVARRNASDRVGEARTLNNLGLAFQAAGRSDSALAYYRLAYPILASSGNRSAVGLTLTNIGRVHRQSGRPDSALAYARQALNLLREAGDEAGTTWALEDLAHAHQAAGVGDSAAVYFRDALASLRRTGDRAREGDVLAHLAAFHRRTRQSSGLHIAIAYYDSAAAVRAAVGARAGGDANLVSFSEQDADLYEEWALTLLAWDGTAGAGISAPAALAVTERGRAQALLDLMRDSSSVNRVGGDLAAEGIELARRLSQSRTSVLTYLVTSDTLVAFLVRPDGAIHISRTAVSRDSLAALVGTYRVALEVDQSSADSNGIRGWLRGDNLEARGVKISPTNCSPGSNDGRGIKVRAGCDRASSSLARLADALSDHLVPEDIRRRLPRRGDLVIVPHGPLTLVPFAALPLKQLSRLPVRYAPSIATLLEVEAQGRDAAAPGGRGGALIVGDPVMPSVGAAGGTEIQLPPLPGSRREGEWIGRWLGVAPLSGEEATETAVRARMADAPLIHLATHGFAYSSPDRSRESFIALASDRAADGRLTVAEVLEEVPPLTADLVVLSACQTGLGEVKQAEGTVGLQRAFLARGARSVLVSLWSVSDTATEMLMQSFYRHWTTANVSTSKAEALRRAQQDVRRTAGFEHPKFWAAFQLVGAH